MTRPLPGLRLAASLLIAGGIYAVLPSAHALTGAENLARSLPPEVHPAAGVVQSFIELAPERSAWVATLCGVGLLLGLRRMRRTG